MGTWGNIYIYICTYIYIYIYIYWSRSDSVEGFGVPGLGICLGFARLKLFSVFSDSELSFFLETLAARNSTEAWAWLPSVVQPSLRIQTLIQRSETHNRPE